MKPRHLVLGATLLVAGAFAIFGDKSPAGGAAVVEAAPRNTPRAAVAPPSGAPAPARVTTSVAPSATPQGAPVIIALVPRERLMGEGGASAGVFDAHSWTPPPPPPPKPPPPPPPVAPPLPFTYLGKAQENGAWDVFLARGGDTLVVRSQMVIDGVYRVDAIAPPTMTLTYLPLKQVQQLNIGVPD